MNRTRPPESRHLPFREGELLPQFAVRDDRGQSDTLRAVLEGNPTILIYLPRPGSSAAHNLAKRLAGLTLNIPRLNRALLVPATACGSEVLALAEPGLTVLVAQREGDSAGDPHVPIIIMTDAATRILEINPLSANQIPQLAKQARQVLAAIGSPSDNAARSRTAPVLIIPNVLSSEHCKRLIGHFEQSDNHPSGILDLSGAKPQWRPDPSVKSRRDLRLEDRDLTRELERVTAAKVLPEIRKCFHYVVTHHEPFKLVRYDEGNGYFRPHRDNESTDTDYRRFAMTLNLDSDAYEGGALRFPEFDRDEYRPMTGSAIVFSCSLLHEATDVTRGSRHVLLGFFYNPADGLSS